MPGPDMRTASRTDRQSGEARGLFTADHREEPYWWTAAPPAAFDAPKVDLQGRKADVVVVGGGVTGLVAALTLARGGADVLVVDAGRIGAGAARRNAGFLGRTLKRSLLWLERHHGAEQAVGIYRELDEALQAVEALTEAEGIACHRRTAGRFIAANSEPHLRDLLEDLEAMKRKLGFDYEAVSKTDLRAELASDRYVGGAVVPALGSIHPGLYHAGLLERAREAGVRFQQETEVLGIAGDGSRKAVGTTAGTLSAGQVILATNGYTTPRLTWFARRLVPFHGYMLATELLPSDLIDRVLPQRRTYLDTKMNIDFIRPAPDSERILFGGMTGRLNQTGESLAPQLHARLVAILPDLKGVRISRSWTGFCAGTLDFMPHIGQRDGVHFALGYNFAGVPIGTLFGQKLAARILGRGDGQSRFDVERFPALPFARGRRLIPPLAMRYFERHDRQIAGKR